MTVTANFFARAADNPQEEMREVDGARLDKEELGGKVFVNHDNARIISETAGGESYHSPDSPRGCQQDKNKDG